MESAKVGGRFLTAGAAAALFLLAGCMPITSTGAAALPAPTTAAAETGASSGMAAGLMLADSAEYGQILVDSAGMTLYQFDKDTQGGPSTCYDKCAEAWPPLLVDEGMMPTLGDGVEEEYVGTVARDDGTTMVTFNGWPVYYFFKDAAPGDTLGQGVNDVWWVLSPEGEPMRASAAMTETAPITGSTAVTDTGASSGMAAGLMLADSAEYGSILVDADGMTLYQFDKDTQGGPSTCYDRCAVAWPPLLVDAGALPMLGDGVDASLVGTVARDDGTTMVTYNGWPVYYYYEDAAPGDTLGQGANDVWWVLSPAGEPMRTK